jgi:hypothetical protein
LQWLTKADFDELSDFGWLKYKDEMKLVKERYEQKRVHAWDWQRIEWVGMHALGGLGQLDDNLATFLLDSLLEQWKNAQRYWQIMYSLRFFFHSEEKPAIWHGRELDIIEALASAFLQIEKAESCNRFHRMYVFTLTNHLPS